MEGVFFMRNLRNRLGIIFLLLTFFFSLLIMRLAYIQIVIGDELHQQAIRIQSRYISSEEFSRADITDSEGVSLIGSEVETREAVITRDRRAFIRADLDELVAVANSDEYYIFSMPLIIRYGEESLARHLIGHLADGRGAAGLERIYDDYLVSTPRYLWRIVLDRKGNIVPGLSFQIEERDVLRNQLVLTLNKEIQMIVESVMDHHSIIGAVVVMNPHNGDLLAVASRPNYDQNNILAAQGSGLLNKAFQFYFPASVFKIFIAAAVLEEGLAAPVDRFYCTGAYVLPTGLSIGCWYREGHGNLNFIEAMAHSCNPVFIDVGLRLGRSNILRYAERLGLTRNTIMGHPQNEVNRINVDFGPGSIANASLGQEGIMITPVQMGVLTSSIANGGYAVTPRVVMEIQDEMGRAVQEIDSVFPYKIWSDTTVSVLKDMLYAAGSWGTGINAWSNEVPSAGKTGTAERGRGLNALFSGYFPLDNPEYVIVVVAEGGRGGGIDAAPIFREIKEKITMQ